MSCVEHEDLSIDDMAQSSLNLGKDLAGKVVLIDLVFLLSNIETG